MKKTKYFAGSFRTRSQLPLAITEAEDKRDEFIKENEDSIEELDCESIQFIGDRSSDYVSAIISLTYFEKNDTQRS
jgi:hypothetical protein